MLTLFPNSRGSQVFSEKPASFDVADFDIALYQIGNNGYHSFVYDQALKNPGVVVLHESNLHHLIAERTIKRNDWDAYMREVEFDGGAGRARLCAPGAGSRGRPRL